MNRPTLLLLPALIAAAGCSNATTSALRLARRTSRAVKAVVASEPSYAYTYGPTGLVTSIASSGGAPVLVATYPRDALGRVTQKGDLSLAYGPDGHLASATSPAGTEVTYVYDEGGERIAKSSAGAVVEAYIPEGLVTADALVEQVEVAGRAIGLLKNGSFESVAFDSRGTALAGTDGETMLPSPYGARETHPDVSPAIDYTKHGYDADLDAVRMGVRDYDAATATFLEPDPLFLSKPEMCVKSPVECGLYGYARASPVDFVDPSGTEANLGNFQLNAYSKFNQPGPLLDRSTTTLVSPDSSAAGNMVAASLSLNPAQQVKVGLEVGFSLYRKTIPEIARSTEALAHNTVDGSCISAALMNQYVGALNGYDSTFHVIAGNVLSGGYGAHAVAELRDNGKSSFLSWGGVYPTMAGVANRAFGPGWTDAQHGTNFQDGWGQAHTYSGWVNAPARPATPGGIADPIWYK